MPLDDIQFYINDFYTWYGKGDVIKTYDGIWIIEKIKEVQMIPGIGERPKVHVFATAYRKEMF